MPWREVQDVPRRESPHIQSDLERKIDLIDKTVGFAVCGSFCTHHKAMEALEQVKARFTHVVPIVSECTADTDTRFGKAQDRKSVV